MLFWLFWWWILIIILLRFFVFLPYRCRGWIFIVKMANYACMTKLRLNRLYGKDGYNTKIRKSAHYGCIIFNSQQGAASLVVRSSQVVSDRMNQLHRSQIFGFVASVAGFSSCGVDFVKDGPVRVQKDDQAGCATVSVSQSDLHHAEAPRIGLPKTADGLIVTKTMFAAVCVMSLRPRVPDMVISILCWEPTECLEELLAHRDCCTHIGFVISNLDV